MRVCLSAWHSLYVYFMARHAYTYIHTHTNIHKYIHTNTNRLTTLLCPSPTSWPAIHTHTYTYQQADDPAVSLPYFMARHRQAFPRKQLLATQTATKNAKTQSQKLTVSAPTYTDDSGVPLPLNF